MCIFTERSFRRAPVAPYRKYCDAYILRNVFTVFHMTWMIGKRTSSRKLQKKEKHVTLVCCGLGRLWKTAQPTNINKITMNKIFFVFLLFEKWIPTNYSRP